MQKPVGAFKVNQQQTQMDKVEQKLEASIPKEGPTVSPKKDSIDPIRPKRDRLDPLSRELECRGYMMNQRFPWLRINYGGRDKAISVDRYYQEHKLLLDFQKPASEADIIKLKQKLAKENGFHYFHCKDADAIRTMVDFCLKKKVADEKAQAKKEVH